MSEKTGENISLPTEQQWQWAGQGNTLNIYPYGNQFDRTRCNYQLGKTTPVTKYEGNSPFEVADMSGNIKDWCLTKYFDGSHQLVGIGMYDYMVVRGGAFTDEEAEYLRVDYRDANRAYHRLKDLGFRIVRN